MIATTLRRLASLSAAALVMIPAACAHAADASAWDGDARSGIRLIAGAPRDAASLRAGLELRLMPGWKTYWRYPGDSGVPPRFDFSQSTNVQSVEVAWPAPRRIADTEGQTIGYKDGVIFPLRITPEDAAQPVMLRLKVEYAVCERLCVPAEGMVELALTAGASAFDAPLAAAEARLPAARALNDGSAFAIRSVRREAGERKPRVVVDVTAPKDFNVDLFAEGPTPEWALPLPTQIAGAPAGERRFVFDLDGLPPGATPDGAMLTLTAVAGSQAIEVKAGLD